MGNTEQTYRNQLLGTFLFGDMMDATRVLARSVTMVALALALVSNASIVAASASPVDASMPALGGESAQRNLAQVHFQNIPSEQHTAEQFVQSAQLLAAAGASGDLFGTAVGLSGDTAVVGAHFDDAAGVKDQGSVYVFARSGAAWIEQQQLVADDGAADDQFGWSVAVDGNTIVAGAYRDNVGPNADQGSAYVFVWNGSSWTQQAHLTANDGAGGDRFGFAVAITGDTVVVGAPRDNVGANADQGSVYVFVRSGDTWTLQQQLLAGDGATGDEFGHALDIKGDTLVVGAPQDNVGLVQDQGSAYVYTHSGTVWTQQKRLTASDGAELDLFGQTVAADADRAVVGAPGHRVSGAGGQGAVYVFTYSNATWLETRQLLAADGAAGDVFGTAVALADDTVVVGAPKQGQGRGSVYIFTDGGGIWAQEPPLTARDGVTNDEFGNAVAIDGVTVIAGAVFDDVGSTEDQGSAYVFEPNRERQTIDFPALPDRKLGDPPFSLGATASSGLAVSFSSRSPSVCTVAGGVVTLVAEGICTVVAQQSGDGTYGPASVVRSFAVVDPNKQSQTIDFPELPDRTLGDAPFAVAATASSGLPITFASATPEVCTVSGNLVTVVAVGTCVIQATQSGNASYNPATTTQSFAIVDPNMQSQTIDFPELPDRTLGDAPFGVAATASSGLPVRIDSRTPNICAISGNAATLLASGICTLVAEQGGNDTYNSATAIQSFAVLDPSKEDQTISFPAQPERSMGIPPFTLNATASSGLPVRFSSQSPSVCTVAGSTVTLRAPGICTIRASQDGNAQFNPATAVRTFAVLDQEKQRQTISFPDLPDRELASASFPVSATASSGLPVVFTTRSPNTCAVGGNTVTLVQLGICTIVAVQGGNDVYSAAVAERSFAVIDPGKQSQTITFVAWPETGLVGQVLPIQVTASSGLPVALSAGTPAVCEVNISVLTLLAAGTCTIAALQSGNESYNAETATQSLAVSEDGSSTPALYLPFARR